MSTGSTVRAGALSATPTERIPRATPPRPTRRFMVVGAVYAVAATAGLLLLPEGHGWRLWPAVAAVAVYLLVGIVRFPLADSVQYASIIQPAFVVLLFAAPLNLVPLIIPLMCLVGTTLVRYHRLPPYRVWTALANSWYCLPPAVILALLARGPANWSHWPVYVLAFAAEIAVDELVVLARSPRPSPEPLDLATELLGPSIDALLTPIGLAAAVAELRAPAATVAVLAGVVGVMVRLSRERLGRIEQERRALRDGLTQLANRSLFDELLGVTSRRCARAGTTAALLLIDLDEFKEINDRHGHIAGDTALRGFADRLRSVVRSADCVARFGGDEFAVLLSDPATLADGERVARAIESALGPPITLAEGAEIQLGASVGVAEVSGDRTPEEVIAEADARLYEVKSTGRSRHAARGSTGDPETELAAG